MSTTSSSVKSRVEDLVGEIQDDATAITQWASDTAREVINLLPQDMLWSVSTTKSDGGGGTGAVVAVTVTNEVITAASVTTAGSGYLSDPEITVTDTSGSGAEIRGFSDGGALIAVDLVTGGTDYSANPTITVSSGGGVSVATAKFLYAEKNGYQATEIDASNKARATDSGSIYNATVKSPVYYREGGKIFVEPDGGGVHVVDYPTIAYGNSGVTGVPDDVEHLVIMGAAVKGRLFQLDVLRRSLDNITAPDYNASNASLVLVSTPSIADLALVSAPSDLTPPSFSEGLIESSTVSFEELAPVFSKPVFSPPSFPTITDLDMSSISGDLPNASGIVLQDYSIGSLPSNVPTYTAPIVPIREVSNTWASYWPGELGENDPGELSVSVSVPLVPQVSAQVVSAFGTAPSYTPPVAVLDMQKLTDYIETEEDVELAQSQLGKIQVQISKFKSDMANALNSFNEDSAEYQANVQHVLKESELLDANEQRKVQKYQAELGSYQSETTKQIQEYQQNMAKYSLELANTFEAWKTEEMNKQQKFQSNLTKYDAEMKNSLNTFNKENVEYQAELQKVILDAQSKQPEDAAKMQKLQGELSRYSALVNNKIQEYQNNEIQNKFQKWVAEYSNGLQEYNMNIQAESQKFNEANNEYQAKLQIAMRDAEAASSEYLQEGNNKLQREVQEYTNKLQNHGAILQKYQAEVNAQLQEYGVNEIQKEIELWRAENNQKLQKYGADLQKEAARHGSDMQKYQIDVNNIFQKHQAMMGELGALQSQYREGLQNFVASYRLPKGEKDGE
jgi:hypothetical protein